MASAGATRIRCLDHRLDALAHQAEALHGRRGDLRRTGRADGVARGQPGGGEFVERCALQFIRLHGSGDAIDRQAAGVAGIADRLRGRDSPSAPAVRRGVGGKLGGRIGREDRGIDVAIAIEREAGRIAEDDCGGEIVVRERPEHRADPAVAAVGVAPPALRTAAAVPSRQRSLRRHRRTEDVRICRLAALCAARILRPQRCGAVSAAPHRHAGMAQARHADHVADGETRDTERAAAEAELRLGATWQQRRQNHEGCAR